MTSSGLERVHDRLDEVISRLNTIGTDVAVMRAEHTAVKTTVEALSQRQEEHDKRLQSLEHDRSSLRGWGIGIATSSAVGGAGLGAVLRSLGVIP